jgi:hypothetical protein
LRAGARAADGTALSLALPEGTCHAPEHRCGHGESRTRTRKGRRRLELAAAHDGHGNEQRTPAWRSAQLQGSFASCSTGRGAIGKKIEG